VAGILFGLLWVNGGVAGIVLGLLLEESSVALPEFPDDSLFSLSSVSLRRKSTHRSAKDCTRKHNRSKIQHNFLKQKVDYTWFSREEFIG